jgi:hypothetical protein
VSRAGRAGPGHDYGLLLPPALLLGPLRQLLHELLLVAGRARLVHAHPERALPALIGRAPGNEQNRPQGRFLFRDGTGLTVQRKFSESL